MIDQKLANAIKTIDPHKVDSTTLHSLKFMMTFAAFFEVWPEIEDKLAEIEQCSLKDNGNDSNIKRGASRRVRSVARAS